MNPILAIVWYISFVISLSVHEYAHALVGYLQGDETARRSGRLTLNPMAHADLTGTVILPLIAIFSGLPVIGWAKPVPFNPYNLRDQRWGPVKVALAGPAANVLMAAIGLVGIRLAIGPAGLLMNNLLVIFLANLVATNIWLGIFNLIPVPPLDGYRLLSTVLDSPKYARTRFMLETKGPTILLFILLIDLMSPLHIFGGIFGGAVDIAYRIAGL